MNTLALIGASGFIGLRATELLHEREGNQLRPVVRAPSSLAVLARQNLDWRISDILDEHSLAAALRGSAVCVHAALGDARQIVRMAEVAYRACRRASVPRLIWLSSASVHGQNPPRGTNEESPLHDRHPLVYNNAKVRAEWALERLQRDGAVRVVRLRPSVVYGPRSRWITDMARDLTDGRAAWIAGGSGICNAVFVDNLVSAIGHLSRSAQVEAGAYYVGDDEVIRWRDFIMAIANRLGKSAEDVTEVPALPVIRERESWVEDVQLSKAYARLMRAVPDRIKRVAKGSIRGWRSPAPAPNAWSLPRMPTPSLSPEMNLLQQCEWPLSNARITARTGWRPEVGFAEGMARSLDWLQSVGLC